MATLTKRITKEALLKMRDAMNKADNGKPYYEFYPSHAHAKANGRRKGYKLYKKVK